MKANPTNDNLDCGPYVQNLTESIKRIFQQVGVGVAMKPVYVLSNIFCKPKDKVLEKEKSGLLYQIFCRDCDAVFYRLNRSKLRN